MKCKNKEYRYRNVNIEKTRIIFSSLFECVKYFIKTINEKICKNIAINIITIYNIKKQKGTKNMKKIIFSAVTMDIGGIEKALLSLINYLAEVKENDDYKYEITLILEKKQGIFLKDINKRIKVKEYKVSNCKVVLFRKIVNLIRQTIFKIENMNIYDFSACYASYSLPGSFVARTASKNSVLWVHSEYMKLLNDDKQKYKDFFNQVKAKDFKKIVFVSKNAMRIFNENFAGLQEKAITIYNLINYEEIINKSKEKISEDNKNIYTFLNLGRQTEEDKRLSRIIYSAKKLKEDNLEFRILFIGEGKDTSKYKQLVKENNLEKQIIFLGKKDNPYPYFKIADSLIMTSEYEGFPVVYIEAMILGLPIITTDVSDSKEIIEKKYGVVVEKNVDLIYNVMKKAITKGLVNNKQFNCENYNRKIAKKLENLIDKK